MKPIIEIEELSKSFRRVSAVDKLSMNVSEGRVTAFLGPNGAGKTTTIKCVLNLQKADSGTIRVLGRDSSRLGPEEFKKIGYVSENQEIPEWMTVKQFLDYCRPLYPTWDSGFEKKMLRDFDLPPNSRLNNLSRGMRMKAALLSSLAFRPKLVVLDEPFSGLDPLVREDFIRGLLELTEEEGWSVFVSSHDIEEVERMADDVAIINRGKLPLHESTESLGSRFRRVEVRLENSDAALSSPPETWLNFQQSGRLVTFVESSFEEADFDHLLRRSIPFAASHQAHAMSLREIFVALARTYRFNGQRGAEVRE